MHKIVNVLTGKITEIESEPLIEETRSYDAERRRLYPSHYDLIVALWEKIIEGRGESADALETERQKVKKNIPKPE